ncbi:M13 family peptidase [Chitinophaga costaii]|nr:M13 family peptidase [Chitinophaga costaii]
MLALPAILVGAAAFVQRPPAKKPAKVPAFDLTSLDRSVDPCTDFDQFANGNWKKNNPIPGTESGWGAFNVLDKENKEVRVKGIILNIVQKSNLAKGTEEQQISDFYRSFVDTVTIAKRGVSPLAPWFDKINAVQTLADWAKVCGELQQYNISTIWGFGVGADAKNSKWNTLYEGQDGLTLGEKSYYERTDSATVKVRRELVATINQLASLAAFPETNPGQTILDFETKLAKFQLANVELRDPVKNYNKSNFAELKTLAPSFDWDGFTAAQGLTPDTIVLQNKQYLQQADALVKSTPIETLKLYTRWQLLGHYASLLSKPFDDANFHFFGTVMAGRKEQKDRVTRGIRATDAYLGMPLGKLFAKQYFPESSKQKVSEMIENVRTVFGQRIDQLSWMSDSTKKMAHTKLASFTYKIGYPDKWKDYSTIDINPATLVENVMATEKWRHKDNLSKLGKPVDKTDWGMTPQTVNAYYNPLNNEVVFPAGILQPPFFNPDADDAINYGGIIAVIGHEFTHGFDDEGSQYDADGNLKNWWTASDRANFDKLTSKYADYFSGIEVLPGFNINGKLTLGENTADLGGLTLAYYALKNSFKGKAEPKPIDGFTWQQRFFLGWAQVWHGNQTEASLRNQVQTNPHAPARNRINGPFPHLKEFADAWHCKNSKMALADTARVVIW